ncbi:hypothetical protein LTR05_004177 [Lithohypha guttulata]|uniref:chitin synthase n=1 Tax=Lithohypha guttulata TaxID=1690604 RepID=A0AAN7T1B6_9EURO|nr:hypothetical protein LTR05_004177 [Lithohypha guttulata]
MAANRYSQMSGLSAATNARQAVQQPQQVSTTTLLNALHTIYSSGQPYSLDASTSILVNTWSSAQNPDAQGRTGGTIDDETAVKAWEHARRRAEDGCIVLASAHPSTPSLFTQFLRILPVDAPDVLFAAVTALRPFLTCVTPLNVETGRHSSLAATYTLSLAGKLTAIKLALSTSGIDVDQGLLNIPSEPGYRAFDVFYYLHASASASERETLGLKPLHQYSLLNRSATFEPPSYLPTADDAASAEDFRNALKAIGIKGAAYRGLLSALAALLKLGDTLGLLVDAEQLEEICEDVGSLLGIEPEILLRQCSTDDRQVLIAGIYEALVDWVILKANAAITVGLQIPLSGDSSSDDATNNGDEVSVTVIEIPPEALGKAVALRSVFDDTIGINAEMKEDGVEVVAAGHSVLKEMQAALSDVAADLAIAGGPVAREREHDRDRRHGILERVGIEAEQGGFLKTLLYPTGDGVLSFGTKGRFELAASLASSRVWFQLSLHPTDDSLASLATLPTPTSAWSAGAVSRQLRAWRLPEWANRRNRHLDFTADFDVEEFVTRYSRLGCKDGRDGVETFILERGWSNGEVVLGRERIWMRENAWWEAETMLDMKPMHEKYGENPFASSYSANTPHNGSGFFPPMDQMSMVDSRENLLDQIGRPKSMAPTAAKTVNTIGGDYGLGPKGDDSQEDALFYDTEFGKYTAVDPELADTKRIESKKTSKGRQAWVSIVWALTFFIPSILLRSIGRMKRPDVRMAWREKLVLNMLIFLFNATVIFYIVVFGKLLCPNMDKAWNAKQVGYHQGTDDYYVSIFGKVYDMTKFYKTDHSDTNIKTDASNMMPFAGMNLDAYFPPPLSRACPGLNVDESVQLQYNDTAAQQFTNGVHYNGERFQGDTTTALHSWDWFGSKFLPTIKQYYKGALVVSWKDIRKQADEDQRSWVVVNNKIYDLTDYLYTLDRMNDYTTYKFLPDEVTELFQKYPGTDVTDRWGSSVTWQNSLNCLNNAFYKGETDFRESARCQVNNYLLLAFAMILCAVILTKFLAALQLGSKRRPSPQDKFVICQVPAYTEGEDHLRKSLDSLTALQYDNKRKLICVICDGMIVGGGNDRPTPKIVLDILGVDPKIDPPALPFRSVGAGNQQLNYGKVYSGLYEFEGNVVPYIVVVKVGKESEQNKSKPGNRGKRDSQILLMQFLNRVHHRAAMSPLELEMFHQINNIIGVDPELYEYLLMVDADTMVREDSLNRLVAACANDAKIAGICGETSLENEERSWWTMIQVYEYYISHHLAKAFESLFGSVTCLPGCFCMYRLRSADKGKPLIIADKLIQEYADCEVDTLHKKNLLALGEDRYLTTLMTKHFPHMSYKFVPDAYALTAAPETWSVLLSQRRRWINSTVHNLAELVWLKDLCGFCCFSMRFIVFLDLFGTIILPATCVYLGYLIYIVATGTGQFPLISIIMIAAVYGLQAIIFIVKRQWQHVGWMIIYIIAYPIYSFILPIYSFWKQDDFSWGNTRVVIGEKGDKKVVALQEEGFDPRSIPLQKWDDYATHNGLPGRRGEPNGGYQEKGYAPYSDEPGYGGMEMDDMHSTYSSVKPTSTILNNFHQQHGTPYMVPPHSPMPYARGGAVSGMGTYKDQPVSLHNRQNSLLSTGSISRMMKSPSPGPYNTNANMSAAASRSLLGLNANQSRPGSAFDFRTAHPAGPSNESIVAAIRDVLHEVDLDSVTKKQVRALVEQRLQAEVPAGDRRAFLDRAIDEQLANM